MDKKPKAPKTSEAEKTQLRIAGERQELSNTLKPIRDDVYQKIKSFKTERNQMRNLSSNDAALAMKGRAPTTGTGVASRALARSKANAGIAPRVESAANRAHAQAMGGGIKMALGESTNAINGINELARQGHQDAVQTARTAAARSAATAETIGTAGGIVTQGIAGKSKKPEPIVKEGM